MRQNPATGQRGESRGKKEVRRLPVFEEVGRTFAQNPEEKIFCASAKLIQEEGTNSATRLLEGQRKRIRKDPGKEGVSSKP